MFIPITHGPASWVPPNGLPVGSVISYAAPLGFDQPTGASYPPPGLPAYQLHLARLGWLLCDGRRLAVARYPRLFRCIGYLYGQAVDEQGQAQAGFFLLPDYRGRVLRGVNGTATDPLGANDAAQPRDPDATARLPQSPGGWAGNAVGSVQYDALQQHVHSYQMAGAALQIAQQGGQGSSQNQPADTSLPQSPASDSAAVRLSQESRGKNQYVHFLIRAD
ncbi:phage tail protein [Atopomonas hussainii]|uniref:phage tail protein n=1 Tax=Atopomonas hussainii TaxID=1429083 RepID=UPI00090034D0|nr:phage tail protein [Atopomonas hussainii]